jgi:hypothetical protein
MFIKKLLASIAAALSTPEAVTAEKSLVAIVLIRVAILVPSAAWVIDSVVHYLT